MFATLRSWLILEWGKGKRLDQKGQGWNKNDKMYYLIAMVVVIIDLHQNKDPMALCNSKLEEAGYERAEPSP